MAGPEGQTRVLAFFDCHMPRGFIESLDRYFSYFGVGLVFFTGEKRLHRMKDCSLLELAEEIRRELHEPPGMFFTFDQAFEKNAVSAAPASPISIHPLPEAVSPEALRQMLIRIAQTLEPHAPGIVDALSCVEVESV